MLVVKAYSFNGGLESIKANYPEELNEILDALKYVDGSITRTKVSKEKTMPGRMLLSPIDLNKALLENYLYPRGWTKPRINFEIPLEPDADSPRRRGARRYLEGDGVKNHLGLEVQFGKYAFLGWDILGKMVIFSREGIYDMAVEIVPMSAMQQEMSTGIGSFEQIVNILERRGVSNLDIPVAVLGINI